MSRFSILLKKNFSLIVQNKFSYFLIFFLPLIIIALVSTLYYNQTTYTFPLGIVKDNSSLSANYTLQLENQDFIVFEEETKEACIENLASGKYVACVIFPPQFSLSKTERGTIEVFYDNTKRELLPIVQNTLNSGLDTFTTILQHKEIEKLVAFAKQELINLEKIKKELEIAVLQFETLEKNLIDAKKSRETIKSLSSKSKEKLSELDESQGSSEESFDDVLDTLIGLLKDINFEIEDLRDETESSNSTELDDSIDDLDSLAYALNKTIESFNETLISGSIEDTLSILKDSSSDINYELSRLNLNLKRIEDNNISNLFKSINTTYSSSLTTLKSGELTTNSQVLTNPTAVLESHSIDTSKGQLNSLFPSLFTALIVLLCLLIAGNLSFKDTNSSGHLRLFLTLSPNFLLVLSKITTVFIITTLQLLPILILGSYVFLQELSFSTYVLFLGVIIISSLIFITLGNIMGMIFRNQTSFFLANIVLIFMFFLASGKILPLELLPQTLYSLLTTLNPYFLTESLIRRILLGQGFLNIIPSLLILFVWAFGLFLFALGLEAKFLKFIYLQVHKQENTTKKGQ